MGELFSKRLAGQILVYVFGLFLLSFGAALSISSGLGLSPINSLPFVISLILGVNPGVIITITFVIYIAAQFALLGKELPIINVTQIVFAFIFGFFLDASRFILGDFMLPTYAGQLVMLGMSIVVIACGLSLYMEARLVILPPEGIVVAIARKIPNGTFARVKVPFDCALVIASLALALIFLGDFGAVREGTILSALLIGRAIPTARKVISFILAKFNFYPSEAES